MRNSLLPLVLLGLIIACSLYLIRGGGERGAGGPAVFPGILKLPEKQRKMTPSAELKAENACDEKPPADSASWRVVLIAADDSQPLTRTVLLALGEELTRRGCIAILEPRSRDMGEPLPLGADAMLRITTTTQTMPADRPGELAFTSRIEAVPVRVAVDHPAARWFPDLPASAPVTLSLRHHSTPVGSTGWPSWFAGVGRSVADALLQRLGTPATVTDTAERVRMTAWILPGQKEADSPYGRIPAPPQSDIVERTVAFQHPFVRGWLGTLSPVPVTTHEGGTRTAHEELAKRLERGKWMPAGDGRWNKDDTLADGTEVHRSITVTGEAFVEWQERPKPTAVWEAWQEAKDTAQLARHAATAGIPASLKEPAEISAP